VPGDFGGIQEADRMCQQAASGGASKLPAGATFRALLEEDQTPLESRFSIAANECIRNVNGDVCHIVCRVHHTPLLMTTKKVVVADGSTFFNRISDTGGGPNPVFMQSLAFREDGSTSGSSLAWTGNTRIFSCTSNCSKTTRIATQACQEIRAKTGK
jgi:hypothetical protein